MDHVNNIDVQYCNPFDVSGPNSWCRLRFVIHGRSGLLLVRDTRIANFRLLPATSNRPSL